MYLVKLNNAENVDKSVDAEGKTYVTTVEYFIKDEVGNVVGKESCFLIGHGYTQEQISKVLEVLKEKHKQRKAVALKSEAPVNE